MNPNDDDDRTLIRPPKPIEEPSTPVSAAVPAEAAEPASTVTPPAQTSASAQVPAKSPPPAPTANDSGNALPVGTRLGEFEITGVLGEGGFGIVYLAQDHSLQRRVALKEYLPSALAGRTGATMVTVRSDRHRETFELGLRSFVNEAQLLAQFDHASLVKVYRFWEANGSAYMVMPFYQGMTLRDRLREMGEPPDEAWLLGLLAPLTQALSVIHTMQCYHRDIAPDNIILLAGSGRPLLLDFGAARRVIGDMTQALTVILKPGYAPLEQYAEIPGMKQGPWTDVYALGAVVYSAVTGRTPPPAVGRMVNDTCTPLVEVAAGRYSEGFLRAIDRALRVRPEDRTQSIDELRADLGLADTPDTGHPDYQATQFPGRSDAPPTAFGASPRTAGGVTKPPVAAKAGEGKNKGGKLGLILGVGLAVVALGGYGAYRALAHTPAASSAAPGTAGTTPASANTATLTATPPPAPIAATPAPGPTTAPIATAAAPATPPAPAAPADAFDQVVQGQTVGFTVKATPAQDRLRIDKDRLRFTVDSAREGFAYVIAQDPDGTTTLLFPNTQASDNHVRAGQSLTLPQASWPVVASDPAGEEKFLVFVAAGKRDFGAIGKRNGWFLSLPNPAQAGVGALVGKSGCTADGCNDYGAARFSVTLAH